MNHPFDELTKSLAQAVTRRGALKQFGLGLAGIALAAFGLAIRAEAGRVKTIYCSTDADCASGQLCCNGVCVPGIPDWCDTTADPCCCYCAGTGKKNKYMTTALPECDINYTYCLNYCGFGNFLGICGPTGGP